MTDLRSTFPLNEEVIARRALGTIFSNALTWLAPLATMAAGAILHFPVLLTFCLGAIAIGGVVNYWQKHWKTLTDELRRVTIADHNQAQDRALRFAAEELRRAGFSNHSDRLERFILVKHQIERRMHGHGPLTTQKIQIEKLIDEMCFGVRDQLKTLAGRDHFRGPSDRNAALAGVDAAFETLLSTANELGAILGPDMVPGDATDGTLAEITRCLREEGEIARGIRARLRAQERAPEPPELPRMETE